MTECHNRSEDLHKLLRHSDEHATVCNMAKTQAQRSREWRERRKAKLAEAETMRPLAVVLELQDENERLKRVVDALLKKVG